MHCQIVCFYNMDVAPGLMWTPPCMAGMYEGVPSELIPFILSYTPNNVEVDLAHLANEAEPEWPGKWGLGRLPRASGLNALMTEPNDSKGCIDSLQQRL